MSKLTLDVVTPQGVVFSDKVDSVIVDGIDGQLGILPDHIPLFTAIKYGIVSYTKGNETDFIAVMGGFLDVSNNRVTVLSNSAEKAGDIDVVKTMQLKDKAAKDMLAKSGEEDFQNASLEQAQAQAKLKAVEMLEKAGGRTKRRL